MIKDSMILTFSKGIRSLLMLVFNIVVVRILSESLYGTYKHINLIVNLTTLIFTLGIPTTISYFYSTYDKENRNYLVGNTISILSAIGIGVGGFIILFGDNIAKSLNNPMLSQFTNLIALYVIVMIISSFLENLYISSQKSVLLGKIYVVYILALFLGMLISVAVFKDLNLLIIVSIVIEFIRTIIMYFKIKKEQNLVTKIDTKLMKNQIRFAIPLGIVAIVQNLNAYIDNLFISNKFSTEKYAAYANAATDIPFVSIITVSIAAIVLPKMVKAYSDTNNFKNALKIWGESTKNTAIIMFPIFWIAILFSTGYIEFIFSKKYVTDSTPIFIIYLLKFPLYCTVYGNILLVLKKQKEAMYNTVLGVVLNIILNSIFINLFGMSGPAISTVIVQYIVVILQLRLTSKYCNIKVRHLMPYKDLVCIFLIPSVIAIPSYLIWTKLGLPSWLGLFVCGAIIYGVSLVIYLLLGYIDKSLINKILSKVKR